MLQKQNRGIACTYSRTPHSYCREVAGTDYDVINQSINRASDTVAYCSSLAGRSLVEIQRLMVFGIALPQQRKRTRN